MPFTASHAIVALPFIRTPIPAAAVAVGAMAPDLPLFVRAYPEDYGMTHSFAWFPVTVVTALLLLLLWRCVIRPAARELAPRWFAERLPGEWDAGAATGLREIFARRGESRSSWTGAVIVVLSLAFGVATHIIWDSFTHEGRWGMSTLDLAVMWGPLPAYKWLQYGSSVGGVVVLAVWAALWLRRRRPGTLTRVLPVWLRWSWWLALPALLIVAWTIGYVHGGPFTGDFTPEYLAYRVLPAASAIWVGLGLLLALAVPVARRLRG